MLAYAEFSLEIICVLMFISMMIQPFIGLLAWLENKVTNSNEVNHYSKGEEQVQTSDEINLFFEHDEEITLPGVVWANCACSFCGKLSHITTRCSRCKDALYCSKLCHVMHARFWHKYECVEIEAAEDEEGSPSHGTRCLFMEPQNETSEYLFNEFSDETATHRHGIVSGYDGCAVCGNPSSKKCSRCKAIKYCSQTCQHLDWRSGHKFQCIVEKENSTQGRPVHGNVVMPTNSYGEEEENINAKALILSSQVATNKRHKEVEEQLRSLKEELAKIKNENISLQSEREEWEKRAKFEVGRLYSFRKENEHQLFILKHENELLSNAEKQARQMINSLSQRQHCLQVMVEKQEEYIHMLESECSKARTELEEQNKCVERLTLELAGATQFPMRGAEETRQKLANGFSAVATAEVSQPISLSRNPTFTRQACAICMTNEKDMAFGCGHMTCKECGSKIRKCHICRKKITSRIRLFPG